MTDLEDLLNNTDFSQESKNKENIKAMLLNKHVTKQTKNNTRGGIILNKNRFRKPYAIAAAIVAGVLIAACSVFYGEQIINGVMQLTIGRHATFIVYEDSRNIATAPADMQVRFDYHAEIEREKSLVTYFDTIDDVKPYLAFEPLMPFFIPAGFTLDRISLHNDENGLPFQANSSWYLDVHYTNAAKTQQIYMQLRLMDEETGFTASANSDMRSISINGNEGVVFGNNVIVEIEGVMYLILAGWAESVAQDEVIRMAESLR